MTDYPTMVYRSPGSHRASGGGTFDYMGVDDEGTMRDALAKGWRATIAEAIAGTKAGAILTEVKEAQEAVDDVSPATRDELEQKARELGIGFNARTSDEVLAARIAERL